MAQLMANYLAVFIFQKLIAQHLGVSNSKDAFDVAFSLPFQITEFVGLSFLHSIVTHSVAKSAKIGVVAISNTLFGFLTFYGICGLVFLFLGYLNASWLVNLAVPGFSGETASLAVGLLRISLPLVLLSGLNTLLSATLTGLGIPIAQEASLLVMRILGISCLLLVPEASLSLVMASFVLGQLIYFLFAFTFLLKQGVLIRKPSFFALRSTLQSTMESSLYFVAAAFMASLFQLYLNRRASQFDVGTLAALYFGFSAVFPFTVLLGKPVSIVWASKMLVPEAHSERLIFRRWLRRTGLGIFSIGVVFAVLLGFQGDLLIRLLFYGGAFDQLALERVFHKLSYLVWAIPFGASLWIFLYPLQSFRRGRYAALSYILGSICSLLILWLGPQKQIEVLLMSSVAGNAVQAISMFSFLEWQLAKYRKS